MSKLNVRNAAADFSFEEEWEDYLFVREDEIEGELIKEALVDYIDITEKRREVMRSEYYRCDTPELRRYCAAAVVRLDRQVQAYKDELDWLVA